MFDIGFLELLLVLVIALIVIGPERMPEVARKLGSFMGKTRRFINSMKEDNEWQDTVRELKAAVDMQEEKKQLKELELDLQTSLQEPAHDIDFESLSRPSFGGTPPPVESRPKVNFQRRRSNRSFRPKRRAHQVLHLKIHPLPRQRRLNQQPNRRPLKRQPALHRHPLPTTRPKFVLRKQNPHEQLRFAPA